MLHDRRAMPVEQLACRLAVPVSVPELHRSPHSFRLKRQERVEAIEVRLHVRRQLPQDRAELVAQPFRAGVEAAKRRFRHEETTEVGDEAAALVSE
jgi:hypothetical protein